MDQSLNMVKIAYDALDDKLAEDIKIIDIRSISVLADYFIIADGNNKNQVQAMVDNVQEELFKAGYEEMLRRLRPKEIIMYGNIPEWCEGNIIPVRAFQEKFRRQSLTEKK